MPAQLGRPERPGILDITIFVIYARAIRFSTLIRLCQALDCQPGDLLSHHNAASHAGQSTPDS